MQNECFLGKLEPTCLSVHLCTKYLLLSRAGGGIKSHLVTAPVRICFGVQLVVLLALINSLPIDKFLDRSKLKVFAEDNLKVVRMMIYVFDRVENIVGKGENASYQHFLLFPQCFQKSSLSGSLRVGIV